ncbi:MAG: TolC family protein [Bdellovibrionaceae bacterium]|nr:TolC family protein [Bdellovibrionales bacterium]MCB9086569.1 TolC family protein [Pseudobdellovibrionaceae bacterium]
MKHLFIVLALVLGVTTGATAQESRTLDQVLQLAFANSAELAAAERSVAAQEALIASQYSLEDPMVGVSSLDRGNVTKYGVISQRLRFPVKYYLQGKAQRSRASSSSSMWAMKKYSLRKQVVSLYFSIFSTQKIIQLTKANMDAVREFARVAEKKYAAGRTSQSDSMKAHFEQTRLELDLLRLQQKENSLQQQLKAVVGDPAMGSLDLANLELAPPVFQLSRMAEGGDSSSHSTSPELQVQAARLEAAKWKSQLAAWEFAPDIQLQYQTRIEGNPQDSEIYSISLSVPLFFWKKSAEASAASAEKAAEEYRLTDATNRVVTRSKDLQGQVQLGEKTLKIYQTSLIPQAQGAYNSSRASYRANKTSFLDLLDSERSLYQVKTDYYRSLEQFVASLADLEATLGKSLSNLGDVK